MPITPALTDAGAAAGEAADSVHVQLAEHDPAWARRYARERDRICCALGDRARRIEHIGSTAVPGLSAKPIVDVLVTVDDPEDEAAWLPALEQAGYTLLIREPGHRMLRPAGGGVNLHVWPAEGEEQHRLLLFRQRLRASRRLRRDYERLKRELAARPWPTVDDYADAKGPFIERALARPAAPPRA